MRELRARDLVGIDETTDAITHAYPFSERRTGHRVELRGRSLNSLCAVDARSASGVCTAAMLGSRLFLDEALQAGQAIFGPVLRVG